jgi:ribosomal protein S18 acetylase RimI-like enzyme
LNEIDVTLLKHVDLKQICDNSSEGLPIKLRHAMISDSRFIRRLSRDVFTIYGPYEEILLKWFMTDRGVSTIIACQDNMQIGFAMLSEPSDMYGLQEVSELLGLAVEPKRQGKGVGELLLGAIDTISESLRVKWMFLHTAVDNVPAQRLYKRNGYRNLEIKRSFYPEGQDAFLMCKAVKRMF